MWKLCVDSLEWIYENQKLARRAGNVLMRRLGVRHATILPYGGLVADPIYLRWKR
jgi:hypothetical protein